MISAMHLMQSGVETYIKNYAPSKRKALNGPHTSIGLILISIGVQTIKAAGTGCFSLFQTIINNYMYNAFIFDKQILRISSVIIV